MDQACVCNFFVEWHFKGTLSSPFQIIEHPNYMERNGRLQGKSKKSKSVIWFSSAAARFPIYSQHRIGVFGLYYKFMCKLSWHPNFRQAANQGRERERDHGRVNKATGVLSEKLVNILQEKKVLWIFLLFQSLMHLLIHPFYVGLALEPCST